MHVRILSESTQCRIFLVHRGVAVRRVRMYFRHIDLETSKTSIHRSSMVLVIE